MTQQQLDLSPTPAETKEHAITTIRGVECGLGQADEVAKVAEQLMHQYPDHLVLVQAGQFLHGYDRTAYALHVLKKYKLKLIGTPDNPHLRVGIPAGGHKRRLWPLLNDYGIPYVVAIGKTGKERSIHVSDQPSSNGKVLIAVSPEIVRHTIETIRQHGATNQAAAADLLKNPDNGTFQLKSRAQDLDLLITKDILKLPRDVRTTWGESLRATMHRIMRGVMAYGLSDNKRATLRELSADVDLLKHYLTQSQKLSQLKSAFEHRAALAVEIGRLIGGLIARERA